MMFSFTKDDHCPLEAKCKSEAQCRLLGFRHNPYIGTFHRINYIPFNSEGLGQNVMAELKKHPLVGLLRHSPSTLTKGSGLKGIASDVEQSSPVLSRISFCRKKSYHAPSTNFVLSLKRIPHSVFSNSSQSMTMAEDIDPPSCAICMEPYSNGDELLTLCCSHCFHSECISKWFYQDCLNTQEMASSFSCPKCRKRHSQSGDNSTVADEGIAPMSLLRMGQCMIEEGGYDLLNDLALSETSSKIRQSKQRTCNPNLSESKYSDCGFPLVE